MRVISMMMGDLEVARIEEGKFRQLVKSSPLVPSFAQLYNDCFYGISHAGTFDERYARVGEYV